MAPHAARARCLAGSLLVLCLLAGARSTQAQSLPTAPATAQPAQGGESPVPGFILAAAAVYAGGIGLRYIGKRDDKTFPYAVIPIAGPPLETMNGHPPWNRALLWTDGFLQTAFALYFISLPFQSPAEDARRDELYRRARPYEGGELPAGAHLETRATVPLVVAGILGLSVSYQPSLYAGLACAFASDCSPGLGWLLVPVAGPFIALGFPQSSVGYGLLVADGAVQVLSVGALATGLLMRRPVIVLPASSPATGSTRSPTWRFSAGAPGSPFGITLTADLR